MLWLDPVPVCWLAKNSFAFERYTPLRFGSGPALWNSGALTGVFSTLTMTSFLSRLGRFLLGEFRECALQLGLRADPALLVHLPRASHLELVIQIGSGIVIADGRRRETAS